MTIYTVIAYRENGLDTCRGCAMGRSDSAFDYISTTDIKEAAAFCSDKNLASKNSGREYCSWELTCLIDGMDDNLWWDHNQDHTGDTPFGQLSNAIAEDATTALLIRQEEQKRIEAEQERRRSAAEAERAQLWKEKQERIEFERLSEKYGNK